MSNIQRLRPFNIGDTVELRSGSLPMTITGMTNPDRELYWSLIEVTFALPRGDIVMRKFPEVALRLAKRCRPPKPTIETMVWQNTGRNQWVFGEPVRGFIRRPQATVYLNDKKLWRWSSVKDEKGDAEKSLMDAVTRVEWTLGISSDP